MLVQRLRRVTSAPKVSSWFERRTAAAGSPGGRGAKDCLSQTPAQVELPGCDWSAGALGSVWGVSVKNPQRFGENSTPALEAQNVRKC